MKHDKIKKAMPKMPKGLFIFDKKRPYIDLTNSIPPKIGSGLDSIIAQYFPTSDDGEWM